MSFINVEIWDASGNKKTAVEVPGDVPVNRIIVVLVERLNFPRYDATMGQLLSYKLHHQASKTAALGRSKPGAGGGHGRRHPPPGPEITAGAA